jgi:hypothetical protein
VGLGQSRARWRLARGGIRPSSEVETFVTRRLALVRGGDLPKGYRGRPFGGPLRLFGPWALPCFGPRSRRVWFVGLFVYLLLFFERGVFPRY